MRDAARLVMRAASFCVAFPALAGIEWSVTAPQQEAAPKSFFTATLHLRNTGHEEATASVRLDAEAPLSLVSKRDAAIPLAAGAETTVLHTIYIPPGTPGGSSRALRITVNGETRVCPLRIKETAAFKARATSPNTVFLPPGEKADYRMRVENFGNVPLDFDLVATTSPLTGRSRVNPGRIRLAPGAATEARVEVDTDRELADFTAFVTIVEVKAPEATDGHTSESLYFQTDVFPPEAPVVASRLFETLKGSVRIGVGVGRGNADRAGGGDAVFRQEVSLEGLIAEQTRLEFVESATLPSQGRNGTHSSALSALPGSNLRNYFRVGIVHPRYEIEAGEVSAAPPRLLSSRETGDGVRVGFRPTPDWLVEAYCERNRLTLTDKTVFGAALSRLSNMGPLEFWKIGALGKRDDVGPQGRDWDAAALDTGWKLPGAIPLRAEISGAFGQNEERRAGAAWLAGLHYNRTRPGETDASPLKAGAEFASGGKDFPGIQNGREDRRGYVTFRVSSEPLMSEAFLDFSDSHYKVVPRVEKTLAEALDVAPDFFHTSQSRRVNAGLRWKNLPGSPRRLPSGEIEGEESSFFNKDNFFDRSDEHAVALRLDPFDAWRSRDAAPPWNLSLLGRGGHEEHQEGGGTTHSRFISLGVDAHWSHALPRWIERAAGDGSWGCDFTGRYTGNLDRDPNAYNRTGFTASAAGFLNARDWNARTAASFYQHAGDGLSLRASASVTRRVAAGWWTGIEAAWVHRASGTNRGDTPDEGALLLTFRHDFEIAVPWLARRGQSTGLVFNDLNNDGVREADEPGLPGVKVGVGRRQTLSGPGGHFTLPPMESGRYPVAITPPSDAPLNQRSGDAAEQITLRRGQITPLTIAMTRPTVCEGRVRFSREKIALQEIVPGINAREDITDLSGLEIVATDQAGHSHRSFTRADGFFAIYLEPGTYDVKIDAGVKPGQIIAPARLVVAVERERLENLDFTLTEKVRRIRKTFTAGTVQNP